ncbi:flippase-like domain-containing protein, partial [bacterium]|nr:flippase-like domain-containing protein [bacterium]
IVVIFTSAIVFFLIFLIPSESLIMKTSDITPLKMSGYNLLYLPGYIYFGLAVIFFLISFISILLIAKPGPFFSLLSKLSGDKVGKFISRFSGIELYSKAELFNITLNSIFVFLFNMVQFLFLTYTFVHVPILVAFISFPLTMLGVCLPVTIAGLGAREGVAAWIYSSFGVNSAVGVKASFILFLINMVLPSIIGIIIYNLRSKDSKRE